MDALTAYRSFAKPGYSPARGKIRIYKDRWYLCTFQNTEHDQGGGYYLAEGEYTELLPGGRARKARDARLNHLNAIEEHAGEVWEVVEVQRCSRSVWVVSEEAAARVADSIRAENAWNLARAEKEFAKHDAMTDADVVARYGLCAGWPGHEAEKLKEWRERSIADRVRNRIYWGTEPEIKRIR